MFASPISSQDRDDLVEAAGAVRGERFGATGVRLIVPDAGEASPAVADWAAQQDMTIQSIEPYLPPFDDVFVELINRFEQESKPETVEA